MEVGGAADSELLLLNCIPLRGRLTLEHGDDRSAVRGEMTGAMLAVISARLLTAVIGAVSVYPLSLQ